MLLILVVFGVGIIRSYFTPERTRKILAGKRESVGNVLAAMLGIVTPFCSCSAVPLFIGFVTASVPLGVTFSFLISSPMVNEIALVLALWTFRMENRSHLYEHRTHHCHACRLDYRHGSRWNAILKTGFIKSRWRAAYTTRSGKVSETAFISASRLYAISSARCGYTSYSALPVWSRYSWLRADGLSGLDHGQGGMVVGPCRGVDRHPHLFQCGGNYTGSIRPNREGCCDGDGARIHDGGGGNLVPGDCDFTQGPQAEAYPRFLRL